MIIKWNVSLSVCVNKRDINFYKQIAFENMGDFYKPLIIMKLNFVK